MYHLIVYFKLNSIAHSTPQFLVIYIVMNLMSQLDVHRSKQQKKIRSLERLRNILQAAISTYSLESLQHCNVKYTIKIKSISSTYIVLALLLEIYNYFLISSLAYVAEAQIHHCHHFPPPSYTFHQVHSKTSFPCLYITSFVFHKAMYVCIHNTELHTRTHIYIIYTCFCRLRSFVFLSFTNFAFCLDGCEST